MVYRKTFFVELVALKPIDEDRVFSCLQKEFRDTAIRMHGSVEIRRGKGL